MKSLCKIASLALAMVSLSASAQQMPPLPLDPEVRYGKLDNGLTYYIRHNEEPQQRANFYIAQKVGSVQEEENQRGLAHFLEHMCFNGTEHFEGNRIVKYCESIGVKFGQNLNAYTSTDETVYNINDVPTNIDSNIDSCLLILRDWSDGLLLLPEEIDKERGVIHEEWRMRTSGTSRILNRNLETIYPDSRYGKRMPIGLMSIVDNFKPQELRDYYEKWYRPDLQAIIVVGDIDVDDIEKRIKNTFSDIKMPENAAAYESYPVPDNEEAIYVIDKDPEVPNTMILIEMKSEAMTPEERSTMAYFINDFASDVISIAINQRLRELARNADCPFAAAEVGFGKFILSKTKDSFELYVIPKPGLDAEAVETAMKEIERARRFGITGTEIYRARQEVLSIVDKRNENRDKQKNSYYVNLYVRHFLDGNATPGIETETQIYQMIDKQIPEQAYSAMFAEASASVTKNFVLLGIYPDKEGVKMSTVEEMKKAVENARNAELEAFVDNVKDEPLIANMPKKGSIKSETAADYGYTLWTLSNGIKLYYKQTDFNNSEVLFRAMSFGGNARIAEADAATSLLFADIASNTGLGSFSGSELSKALAGKQVSLRPSFNGKTEMINGNSTPKDLRTLFEMLYLTFQGPTNDEDGYNSIINEYRTQLTNAASQPTYVFRDSLYATLYQHSPYAKQVTLNDIDKVSFDTYKRLYKERFQSAGDFDFYVTGAFNLDSLKTFAEQYLASLPGVKKREAYKNTPVKMAKGQKNNRFTRTMETPQAMMIQLWNGDINYTVKDDVVVNFLNSILDMRYTRTIREEAGFAYSVSVSGYVSASNDDSYIVQIVAPFTPSKCDSVLYLIRESIDDIAKDGVTEEEIDNVRKFELKSHEDNMRKNNYWSNCIVDKTFFGHDTAEGIEEYIKNITSNDIKTFINNVMLKDNNCTTVIMLPESFAEAE